MRRTKPLLWLPIVVAGFINFFALIVAGIFSSAMDPANSGARDAIWWVWLFLFTFSLVILGCWIAYWRKLPADHRPTQG